MPKLDYRNIEKDPARCGGQAVVAGTRIRVAVVLTCDRQSAKLAEVLRAVEETGYPFNDG